MNSTASLLSNILWVLGLASALATFSYMNWLRGVRRWSWSYTFKTPLFLTPLSLSLFLFSGGMASAGWFSPLPTPWWQLIAWSVLTLLFGIQAAIYMRAGNQAGWGAPIEEKSNHE
jgi:hypothetical protein